MQFANFENTKEKNLLDSVLSEFETMNQDITELAGKAERKEREILSAKKKSEKIKVEMHKFAKHFMQDILNLLN